MRLELGSLNTADAFTLLNHTKDAVRSVMGEFEKIADVDINTNSFLPAAKIQTPNLEPLDLELTKALLYVSTHNKKVLGVRYSAGFLATLDASLNGKSVYLHAAINKDGLLTEGRMSPFDVLGVELTGDPLDHQLEHTNYSGYVSVAHNNRFHTPEWTIEAWVEKADWHDSGAGHNLWRKISGSSGYGVYLGSEGCVYDENGANCQRHGRVNVYFRNGGQTRLVQSDLVLPRNKRTHIAVTVKKSPSNASERDVFIYINGALVTSSLKGMAHNYYGGSIILGKLAENANVDDVRYWNVARTAEQIAANMSALPEGSADPNLVARYTFDYNKGNTVYNTRYHGSGSKLHGTKKNTAKIVKAPSDLFFKLAALPAKPTESGVWLKAGAKIQNPLSSNNPFVTRAALGVNSKNLTGNFYTQKFSILELGSLGALSVSGKGPNNIAGDYDDGVYGTLDLKKQKLSASASLLWESNNQISTVASASLYVGCKNNASSCNSNNRIVTASGSIDLPIPTQIGIVRLIGNGSYKSQNSHLDVSGNMKIWNYSLPSSSIQLTSSKATLTTSLSLPNVLGVDLGTKDVELTLDWDDLTLCGSTSHSQQANDTYSDGFTCGVNVCVKQSGIEPTLNCPGIQPCTSDNNCSGDKICYFGLCTDPLNDGTACLNSSQCENHCGGGFCYTKHSKDEGEVCNTVQTSVCKSHLACIGLGVGVCLKVNLPKPLPCEDTQQCAGNLVCKDGIGLGVKQCLEPPQSLGSSCWVDSECYSNKCNFECQCTHTYCKEALGNDYYCAPSKVQCLKRKNDGTACSSNAECKSGYCQNWCYTPNDSSVGVKDICWASNHCGTGSCDFDLYSTKNKGRCRCDNDNDCPSHKFCNTTDSAGTCDNPRPDNSNCKSQEWCSNLCGPKNAEGWGQCYSKNTQFIGTECVHDDQCKGSNTDCDMTVIWGKTFWPGTCKCTTHSDCTETKGSSNWYCKSGECKPKMNDFAHCDNAHQCKGGGCAKGWGQSGADSLIETKRCYTPYSAGPHDPCVVKQHCSNYSSKTRCGGKGTKYSDIYLNHIGGFNISIPTWLKLNLNAFGIKLPEFISDLGEYFEDLVSHKPFRCYEEDTKLYRQQCRAHDECKSGQCGKSGSGEYWRCACRRNVDCEKPPNTHAQGIGCDRNIATNMWGRCRTPKKGLSKGHLFFCFSKNQCISDTCKRPSGWAWGICE